jgi:adhesin/invasin
MIPESSLRGSTVKARHDSPGRPAVVLLALAALAAGAGCHQTPLFAPTGATITLSGSALILPLNGTAQITATVVESGGSAVSNGTTVTFTTTLGSFVSSTATTNAGRAVVTFNAGTQSGTATVTAFSGSVGTSGGTGTTATSLAITIGSAAVSNVLVTASPASVSQLGTIPSTITATVVDANNNGIPGATVLFSTDQGSLSAVTATTNSTGQATTQLTTTQAATVTATVGGKSGTAKIAVYAAPTITITAPSSPTALVASTFTLSVTPGSGAAAISDVTVNFGDAVSTSSVDLGAVSGSVSVSHAYATPGQYTFTVTVRDGSGQTVSASTPVTVYAAIPFTLSMTAAPNSAIATTTLVVFTATPNAGAPAILNYSWDFGDGNKAQTTVPFVSYTYPAVPNGSASQQLLVSVTATGVDGRVGYGSVAVTVTR